ncbi:hypothetical protein HQQ81_09730 [Microbacteriaceae bacterium VKM Ac-2854]|nr:hypothetical protein [Microbacteriaceae bacterium VKM Ac-2854]
MPNLVVSLAESVQKFGVASVYGDPVEVEGSTLVPVALRWYGFGAGSEGGEEAPGGGGGGGAVIPVGAYIKDDLGLRFQPNLVTALAVSIPVIWVSGRALARIVRALKK